jgi:hypothetical protein
VIYFNIFCEYAMMLLFDWLDKMGLIHRRDRSLRLARALAIR